jgi:hypothetical protein
MDAIDQAGRAQLVDEIHDLRCEIAAAEYGDAPFVARARTARLRARAAALEPLVGAELDRLLAAEN